MAASVGPEIERLIALLAKLPGLGPRSARRAALTLLKKREQLLTPLGQALAEASARVRTCSVCGSLDSTDPCAVCADRSRDAGLICVVEEVGALWAMERGGAWRGRYHVLGGLLSALDGVGPHRPRRRPSRPRGGAGAARHRRRPDHGALSRRPPGRRRGGGNHAGARRAGGRGARLAGRRHHRPGAAGAAAGVRPATTTPILAQATTQAFLKRRVLR